MNRSSTRRTMAGTPTKVSMWVLELPGQDKPLYEGFDWEALKVERQACRARGQSTVTRRVDVDASPS